MSDFMSGSAICYTEGCRYREPRGVRCVNCGEVNYGLLSYVGLFARTAKRKGITWEEARRQYMARADYEAERKATEIRR